MPETFAFKISDVEADDMAAIVEDPNKEVVEVIEHFERLEELVSSLKELEEIQEKSS